MMSDHLEYEEDAVTIRSSHLILEGHKPCANSDQKLRTECKSVSVQTFRLPTDAKNGSGLSKSLANKSDMVLVPREQLAMMQKYYKAVKDAYYNYGLTDGDPKEVVRKLFEQTSEVLCAVDERGQSPIESALVNGKLAAGAQLLDLAWRRNQRALRHRTASGEDALMLAVTGGNETIARQLISMGCGRNACLHYNLRGQNSLHLCALGSSNQVMNIMLAELSDLMSKSQLSPDCVTAALSTSDCDGCTPLHYMARGNQAHMLKSVHEFSQGRLPNLDWDARQTSGDRRLTPLAMAAQAESVDACEFLLKHGLAGIDLHEHRDMWLQATFGDSARNLLSQHCQLLEPMTALPSENLSRLQSGLQERALTEEFLLKLRAHWPDLPQLPTVVTVLAVCQNFSGSCRLVVWDILTSLGTGDLAQLLEA